MTAGVFQPIPSTFHPVARVDYCGHLWVHDHDTWVNPATGITRDDPKWTAADAYRR